MKHGLLRTARRLLVASSAEPEQSDLRRSVSTAYYAAFHALAEVCADEVVGGSAERRATPEWTRAYRALDHGRSRQALREVTSTTATSLDPRLVAFGSTLDLMRERRLAADYDPRPLQLNAADVGLMIDEVQGAMEGLIHADGAQRRALAFACILARRG